MSADFRQYMEDRQTERVPGIGPSGVGGCFRQHAFRFLQVPPSDEVDLRKADLGTLIHLGWDALIESRYHGEGRSTNVRVTFGEPLRDGSADDVDWVGGVVRDLKSAGTRTFQYWLDNDGPGQDYWDQVTCYAWGLNDMGHPMERVGIVGIDRETGDTEEWLRPYDAERGRYLVDRLRGRQRALDAAKAVAPDYLDGVLEIVEGFPREGRGRGSFPCDWCPFATLCLGADDVQPEAVTPLEPEVIERAEQAAEDYLAARRVRNEASERMDLAKAVLAGITGTFGSVRVGWGKATSSQVPDADAMERALVAHGFEVPTKWSTRKGAIQVSRVRGKS